MRPRLGIIGGGQLGLYLCEAARGLGVQTCILAESADAPALQCADRSVVGALNNAAALQRLLAASDVITFDKEAIPDETLAYLLEDRAPGSVAVHPGAGTLLLLKDKALQKTWLQQQALPTLPFHILSGNAGSAESLAQGFGDAVVQKSRCGGYDGRGVQVLKSLAFDSQLWDMPSIVEPFLPDCREISVITVRASTGDKQTYPPVSMEFDSRLNSLQTISMPADISPQLGAAAIALAERVVALLDGVGVFAIEMFIAPGEKLLINEISPRVHNSGHVTLDACNVSQFEQHVRAVTGMPLVAIEAETPAAMINILYDETLRGCCPALPSRQSAAEPGTSIYWYGKAPGTAGRKMGHINAVAPSVAAARALANRVVAGLSADAVEQVA